VRLDDVWHRRAALVLLLSIGSASPGCLKREPRGVEQAVASPATPAPRATPRPAATAATPAPRVVPAEVESARRRIHEMLGLLADRELSPEQRDERDTAVSFLAQIDEALDAGDTDRAGVLAEKARILVENLERATRP
jgi:hypothetical protein